MHRKANEAHAQTLVMITSNFLLPQLIVPASVATWRGGASSRGGTTTAAAPEVSERPEVRDGACASRSGPSGERPSRMWSNSRRDRHSVTYMHDGGDAHGTAQRSGYGSPGVSARGRCSQQEAALAARVSAPARAAVVAASARVPNIPASIVIVDRNDPIARGVRHCAVRYRRFQDQDKDQDRPVDPI